jgi:hypothetical protein
MCVLGHLPCKSGSPHDVRGGVYVLASDAAAWEEGAAAWSPTRSHAIKPSAAIAVSAPLDVKLNVVM